MIIGKWEFFSIAKKNSLINEYILKTFYHLFLFETYVSSVAYLNVFPEHLQFKIVVV
jgi:hypothetical protein